MNDDTKPTVTLKQYPALELPEKYRRRIPTGPKGLWPVMLPSDEYPDEYDMLLWLPDTPGTESIFADYSTRWGKEGMFTIHEYAPPYFCNLPVQINGKLIAVVEIDPKAERESAKQIVQNHPQVFEKLGKFPEIKRTIYIPGKIINFVTTGDIRD